MKLRIRSVCHRSFARSEMGWRNRVKLAGKLTRRFREWRIDVYGKPYACDGDYDTVQGLNAIGGAQIGIIKYSLAEDL
jgi:hypothetical protein